MILIKSVEEQEAMRQGGKILAKILTELKLNSEPGVKKNQLNNLAEELCLKYGVEPSFKGYGGFPASVCISVNDEVVHGIPDEGELKGSDLISLDMGVLHKGFHTDSAVSFVCAGKPNNDQVYKMSEEDINLDKFIKTCEHSLYSAIDLIKDGVRLGKISAQIQKTAEAAGYGVIRMLVGHGIGREVHEDPHVPNYGNEADGPILKTGMTIAIEPMITADGSIDVLLAEDGWTYKSATGALTTHAEHTVLVTDTGYEILTQRSDS
jgi:methionyl aminopeptidase